ncbi:MAG: Uma2 family endonuclease [Planctomycetaceae bacterium]|nr:Uma2 family endonuclease [Planctomycetaceae bacterium]
MATTTPPRSRIAPAAPATGNMLYEVVNGQVVEKPPMGAYETWIASRLMRWMISCDQEGRFGQVVIEMLFRIDRATELQLRPDLAFVSHARWPRDRPAPREAAWDVVPDLAVEVVSPSDSANEVIDKLHEYFQAGVQQVWLVYPKTSEVYVYEAPQRVRILGRTDELDGGAILSGFRLPMAHLFTLELQAD